MTQTRCAYMKSPWQFQLRMVDLNDPPPLWVLLRVEACGICGTDLTAAAQDAPDWRPFGHEIAGVVQKLGPQVAGLSPGQKVVLESASFCGRCELCRNGRVDLCAAAPNFWGQSAMGFSDFMLAPACCCVPYAGLSPEQACLAEPGGVAYDMVKVAGVQLGDRVCVVGPGPIGLMAVAMAKAAGAVRLACVGHSHSGRRLELARQFGAEAVACDGPLSDLKQLHRQFDHVLMTAPTQFLADALALLAYEGKLTYVGIGQGQSTTSFDANDFHFRKLQLRASFASPAAYFPRVLSLFTSGVVPVGKLISHRFDLAEIDKAMATNRDDKAATVKIVVCPKP